jgi:TRAP-type mannitol/chloroaromatic compound transport system substrate-binding protein
MVFGPVVPSRLRITLSAALLAAAGSTAVVAQGAATKEFAWKVQSTWPQANLLHDSPVRMGKAVEEMSGGRLKMNVAPAGTYVGAFEVLDAVHKNVMDAAHGWPGYWTGKNMAAGLFGPPPGGPFGLGRDEFLSWLHSGGGMELYNELLQKELKLNVVAFFTTTLCYWEAFGWFRKPFESLADLKKMKFRTSGLGLLMLQNMGITTVQMAGGEVVPSLERGTIDGAEWAIPSHDILMGFQDVTKYYYMPDMRQPPGIQEFLINKTKWDELPADLRAIVKQALLAEIMRMNNDSIDLESKAAKDLAEKHNVKLMRTPDDVLKAQLPAMDKVFEEEAKKNPFFAKVLASQREFAQRVVPHAARMRPPLETAVSHYWAK